MVSSVSSVDTVDVKKLVIDRRDFGIDIPFSLETLTLQRSEDIVRREIVYHIRGFMSNVQKTNVVQTQTIEHPSTPGQFFKQQDAPRWFLKKFPVVKIKQIIETKIEKNFMCPHLVMDNYPHLAWLYNSMERG